MRDALDVEIGSRAALGLHVENTNGAGCGFGAVIYRGTTAHWRALGLRPAPIASLGVRAITLVWADPEDPTGELLRREAMLE